jgi:aryl-alcohol dehydrogenase-like predicted oxidoreductase
MRSLRLEPLGPEVGRLALGTAKWTHAERARAQELTDAFLELGGTLFDTGRAYHESESVVAACLAGRRREAVLATKAAHHDRASEGTGELVRRVTPEDIAADLAKSLETLRTDAVEILMLHRDDPSKPVGPVLEALEEHRRAGRIGSYGASNWSTTRLDEAAAYAHEHGLQGFTTSSVHLSLAEWTEPPWPECLGARDAVSLAWYERTQMPLFAWSPSAAGLFAGAADADVARVFDTPGNRERRRRADELGARLGATATQVALAWLLHRPFPVFPIVGPRTVAELRESAEAVQLELSADDLAFLEVA